MKWASPAEARYLLLGIFIGWVMMLLVWAHTAQAVSQDPDKLLNRSIATSARCIEETNKCLDRLEVSRQVECKP